MKSITKKAMPDLRAGGDMIKPQGLKWKKDLRQCRAEGWQLSTPGMFLYAAQSSIEIVEEAGWNNILAKQNC
jgi:hypothetical protein